MGRTNRSSSRAERRTPLQAAADRSAIAVSAKLGRMLRDGRSRLRLRQLDASARAGLSRSRWSDLECGRDPLATVATWSRAAAAVGGRLEAWIKETSAADQPRDAVHLRNQELIIRLSESGGWTALPEEMIDREARTSRAADVLLTRTTRDGTAEYALWDVWDWLPDVGAVTRDFQRRVDAVDRYAVARMPNDGQEGHLPRTGGCLAIRATARNRRLIADHRHFFGARFPGSGYAWIQCLTDRQATLPKTCALVWISVHGDRLLAARLG